MAFRSAPIEFIKVDSNSSVVRYHKGVSAATWAHTIYDNERSTHEEQISAANQGTSCAACNTTPDKPIICDTCEAIFCAETERGTFENACVTFEEYEMPSWKCGKCRDGTNLVKHLDSLSKDARTIPNYDDIRGMRATTTSPFLMISIHPKGEPPCITGRMIDNSCKAHWRAVSEHYKFVSITASIQPDRDAREDIAQFLQGTCFYRTRVLILINAHSQIGTGHLVFEQDAGTAEAIESLLLRVLGRGVLDILGVSNTLKGLIILACGYTINNNYAGCKSLIDNSYFSFILAFNGENVIEDHVSMGIHGFVKACFMEVDVASRQKTLDMSAVSFARIQSFAGRQNIMAHTGVVLLEMARKKNNPSVVESNQGEPTLESAEEYQATEFRSGQLSIQLFGLLAPVCPFCKTSNNIKYSANNGSVRFNCLCGTGYKGFASKPSDCNLVTFPGIPSNHYLNPFPFPLHRAHIRWKNGEDVRTFDWTGIEVLKPSSD
ncbi:hypothetical protein M407DRAFT_7972 [Tulasnella calospora MUT 4182]|uniref:Uncharacterized protein n=1 Tax=Tulasnella calospora MUT 4182 TaxID=1051891 RepID=A0A0C3LXI9_9AGAM|nr:hypothetical protein M407DRAFT_7972 [Tulasnella calospora MUT 4182]